MTDSWIVRPSWRITVSTATPRRLETWWQLNAQVGGPLQRDRLWYLPDLISIGSWIDRRGSKDLAHVPKHSAFDRGMTMALRPLTRLEGFLSYGEVRQDLADVGQIIPQEVASDVGQRDILWNSRFLAVNGTRLLEVTYGGYVSSRSTSPHPPNTRDGPAPQLDFALGLTGNARAFSDREPRQQQLRAVLTRSSGPGGTHELKAGADTSGRTRPNEGASRRVSSTASRMERLSTRSAGRASRQQRPETERPSGLEISGELPAV